MSMEPTCTGKEATWCPVHGDCTCPSMTFDPNDERTLDAESCPLHRPVSRHAARPRPCSLGRLVMDDDRTCICSHDLIWHDTRGRCNDKTFRDGHSWTCPCHAFRRAVPAVIEGVDEGDLLGELRAIHATLRGIEAWLHGQEGGS